MSVVKNERVEVLDYLKQSLQRLRELAKLNPGSFGSELLALSEQIAKDVAELEAELIEAGYLPKAANES